MVFPHEVDDEMVMGDDVHMRAALLTGDIPGLPADCLPSDDHAGMLKHSDSTANEAKDVARGLGRELSVRLSHTVVPAPNADTRRPSVAFRQGEVEVLTKILDEVDRTAAKRMKEGFNELSFTLGVLNSFFIFFVFGHSPQHFWLLYLIETMIFVPSKFASMLKALPLCEIFYYFDLCWFLNFVAMSALLLFPVACVSDAISISTDLRRHIYLAALGAGCGPLLGATAVLPFVSFLFHDYRTMTGLFIHLLPPMVIYTLRWHWAEMHEAWPNLFDLSYIEDDQVKFFPENGPFFLPGTGLGSVAGNGIALYFLWFIPYVIWMVTIGLDLPRTNRRRKKRDGTPYPPKYDTVFHSTVRGGLAILIGKVCWGRPRKISIKQMEENDFELRDFLMYMLAHMVAAVLSIYVLAYPCFKSKEAHLCIIAGLVFLCTHRGSKRYTYYSTSMYGRMIRKNFDDLMTADAKSK